MCQCPTLNNSQAFSQMCPSSPSVSTRSSWKQPRCWVQQGKVREGEMEGEGRRKKVSEGRSQIKGWWWQLRQKVQVWVLVLVTLTLFNVVFLHSPAQTPKYIALGCCSIGFSPCHAHWSSTFFLAHSFSLKEPDGVSVFYSRRPPARASYSEP